MTRLEKRLPPPVVVFLIGAAMAAASIVLTALPIELALRAEIAVAIIALGFSFVARGFLTFRAAGTTIDPVRVDRVSALVTSGVFRRTRNPMYVGFATMLVGWAAFLAVPWLLLGPAFFVMFTTRFQVVPEERAMRARFGDAYAAYVRRVPRWL
jgi:protein-S-isoprenylcysteine O-methyltransferase Ste14